MDQDTIEYLKKLGISVARGVPQLATGFVDLAALPFTATGLLKPEQAFGSTDWMTAKGYLPPKQEGLLSETAELLSGAINPAGAITGGLLGIGSIVGAKSGKAVQKAIKTAQDEAMEIAQKNAALPIEQGGLGLPKDNTAMDRAKAMGFDVNNPVFHGTNADIAAFNTQGKGKTSGAGAFFTDNPVVSETYLSGSGGGNVLPLLLNKENIMSVNAKGRNWADIDTNILSYKRKPLVQMFDELSPNSATSTDELGMLAKDAGFKGITISNVKDLGPNSHIFRAKEYLKDKYGINVNEDWSNVSGKQFGEAKDYLDKFYQSQKSTVTSIQDPSSIRSRFAAFDPFKRKSSDILAGVGAGGVGLGLKGLLYDDEENY
jgi:hypothetical protein